MTFPPDDQGERPGGPWSQQPQYPPPHRRASYPRYPDQPGYDEPGYPQPAKPGYGERGYDQPDYPQPARPGYGERGYDQPGYPDPGYQEAGPGYQETGQYRYPEGQYPEGQYPEGQYPEDQYPEAGGSGYPQTSTPRRTSRTAKTSRAPGGAKPSRLRGMAGPHNTPAFTGLVLGVLGLLASLLAPILAIVFGITGLTRIRRTGQRGGAMAITGILLGAMWIVLTVLFAVLVMREEGYGSIAALRAGSCFDNAQPGHVAVRVRYLSSCTQPHNGEVVGTFALPGTAWPGQQAVSHEAATGCAELLTSVLGQQSLSSGVRGMNYSPSQQTWSTGTRGVSCVLLDPNATHTGSMLNGN